MCVLFVFFLFSGSATKHTMFSFHKPKVYRSTTGCCICKAKSSRYVCLQFMLHFGFSHVVLIWWVLCVNLEKVRFARHCINSMGLKCPIRHEKQPWPKFYICYNFLVTWKRIRFMSIITLCTHNCLTKYVAVFVCVCVCLSFE